LSKKLYDEDDQRDRPFVSEGRWIAYLFCTRCGRVVRFALGGEMLAVPRPDVYKVTP
jgi:hypothetical protein